MMACLSSTCIVARELHSEERIALAQPQRSPTIGTPESTRRDAFPFVCFVYGASGALGILYEVTFSKYLSYAFGVTAYASSAVLVAFMGGIAVGAHFGARWDRRVVRPLLAYGLAEAAIGLTCMVAPFAFRSLLRLYPALASISQSLMVLTALRWLLATFLAFVPAACMGTTLPFLARYVRAMGDGASKRRLTTLYALNTMGGALGSLTSAYVLIPSIGLSRTMMGSGLLSLLLGVGASALGRRTTVPEAMPVDDAQSASATGRAERAGGDEPSDAALRDHGSGLLVLAAMSGFLVFAAEVVYTHLLALVVGTSVYAFGLVLAAFLLCLAVGASLVPVLERRAGKYVLPISLALAALGLSGSIPLWDRLPAIFVALGPKVDGWAGREAIRGAVAFAALAVPATLMGTTFPIVLRAVAKRVAAGAEVGRLTSINTLGSVLGSVAGGFVILPALGSQRSLVLLACAYAGSSMWTTWLTRASRGAKAVLFAWGAAGLVVGLLCPRWDLFELASGAGIYFESQDGAPQSFEMVREDVHGGVTTVTRNGDVLTLWTNGKFQGNNGVEVSAQRGFAHLPSVFAHRHGKALVVGLGTGTTAGTMAAYPYERIDIAEISPAIVEASQRFFADLNLHVFDDPRAVLRHEDGRNLLLVSREKYDAITIELTSIWFAGAANLYNREFYEIARDHLTEGGVLQQWMQLHHTTDRETAIVISTLRRVFPHVCLFSDGHQGHLLASLSPLHVTRERLARLEALPRVREALGPDGTLGSVVEGLVMDEEAISRFVADVAARHRLTEAELLSTDDNLLLEYATPRNNVPNVDGISGHARKAERLSNPRLARTIFLGLSEALGPSHSRVLTPSTKYSVSPKHVVGRPGCCA